MKKKISFLSTPLNGRLVIPPDKSITHRAFMLSALTKGIVEITNYSKGQDCMSTLNVLKSLGITVKSQSDNKIILDATKGFTKSETILNAGNSGTTIRLMSGILASHTNFKSVISGDESLSKRPMARIINPLKEMGAKITSENNDNKAPLIIEGSTLNGINYNSPIASAQVKSAMLFAGINAEGTTTFIEPSKSRDHSEKMLAYLEANINVQNNAVTVSKSILNPRPINICGDISSAAFFMVAALIVPNSCITLENVGLNKTRTGILDVLQAMGADIEVSNSRVECAEEVGDITIRYSDLKATIISGDLIPRLIDEIPVLAVLATQAEGTTIIKDAEDLRNKESDRISAICKELKKLGANIQETADGLIIQGKTKLHGEAEVDTYHDHRLAMSLYVAGLVCENPLIVNDFQWVNISFPEFEGLIERLHC